MAHAAWCRRRASNPCRRTSPLRVFPAGRGGITGAFGNALSASWLMDLTTAQAIISEKSTVLFCRCYAPKCALARHSSGKGEWGVWRDSSGSRFRRVPANHVMRRGESCQQLCRSLVFLGLSDLPSLSKAGIRRSRELTALVRVHRAEDLGRRTRPRLNRRNGTARINRLESC